MLFLTFLFLYLTFSFHQINLNKTGIEAAISKSKKNIAPKLYARIKDIKNKLKLLEQLKEEEVIENNKDNNEREKREVSEGDNVLVLNVRNLDPGSAETNDVRVDVLSNNLSEDVISVRLLSKVEENSSDMIVGTNKSRVAAEISSTVREESVRIKKKYEKKQKVNNDKIKNGDELLNKINIDIGNEGKIEQTWERIILAEKMRTQLSSLNDQNKPNLSGNSNLRKKGIPSAAELYVNFINENFAAPKKLVSR